MGGSLAFEKLVPRGLSAEIGIWAARARLVPQFLALPLLWWAHKKDWGVMAHKLFRDPIARENILQGRKKVCVHVGFLLISSISFLF